MGRNNFWNHERVQYFNDNYGKLSNRAIAEDIGTITATVTNRAYYLRSKGKLIKKNPTVNWKDPKIKEVLFEKYGSMPTSKLAKLFKTTVGAIHRAASRFRVIFKGSEGRYTITELAKLLKIDEKALRKWIKIGLKISTYAKNGRTNPRNSFNHKNRPGNFCGLINLSNLKKFLKSRPEAYDLNKLDEETRFVLELHRIKNSHKEKEAHCKRCKTIFWTEIHNDNPLCPKCKSFVSKWAKNYR
jgi:hypothetical protein